MSHITKFRVPNLLEDFYKDRWWPQTVRLAIVKYGFSPIEIARLKRVYKEIYFYGCDGRHSPESAILDDIEWMYD